MAGGHTTSDPRPASRVSEPSVPFNPQTTQRCLDGAWDAAQVAGGEAELMGAGLMESGGSLTSDCCWRVSHPNHEAS